MIDEVRQVEEEQLQQPKRWRGRRSLTLKHPPGPPAPRKCSDFNEQQLHSVSLNELQAPVQICSLQRKVEQNCDQ